MIYSETIYNILVYIILFALGAALTSFFNAQIYRIEKGLTLKRLITTPSQCEGCYKDLKWYELIPVFSYIFQRGKCGACGHSIPIAYPITEAIFGFSLMLLYYYSASIDIYILASLLYFLALYDLFHKGFPKSIMHTFLLIAVGAFLIDYFYSYDSNFLSIYMSLLIGISVVILNRIKMSFGTGDLLVILMLSLFLTLKELLGVVILGVMLAGFTMIMLLFLKKVGKKDMVPFVPFLYLGLLLYFPMEIYVDRYFAYILYLW